MLIRTRFGVPVIAQIGGAVLLVLAGIALAVVGGVSNNLFVLVAGIVIAVAAGYFVANGVNTYEHAESDARMQRQARFTAEALARPVQPAKTDR